MHDAEWARVDYCGALGVSPAASNTQIDEAFRRKLTSGDVELLAAAHAVLSDPTLRRQYNELRSGDTMRRVETPRESEQRAYAGRKGPGWLVIATVGVAAVTWIAMIFVTRR